MVEGFNDSTSLLVALSVTPPPISDGFLAELLYDAYYCQNAIWSKTTIILCNWLVCPMSIGGVVLGTNLSL